MCWHCSLKQKTSPTFLPQGVCAFEFLVINPNLRGVSSSRNANPTKSRKVECKPKMCLKRYRCKKKHRFQSSHSKQPQVLWTLFNRLTSFRKTLPEISSLNVEKKLHQNHPKVSWDWTTIQKNAGFSIFKNPGWLFDISDEQLPNTQFYGDYTKPI